MTIIADTFRRLDALQVVQLSGTVAEVRGLTLCVADLPLPVGALVEVQGSNGPVTGEVVGFDRDLTIVMLMGFTAGIRRGMRVCGTEGTGTVPVGVNMLGRIVDALGRPIDGLGPIHETIGYPIQPGAVDPLKRVGIDQPLGTGVRTLDTLLTVGLGQRLGIFSGPGVGKSSLIAQIAKRTEADVSVIALVGERGREVRDFIDRTLGAEGLARSVVVVATSDEPALMRIRAAAYAHSLAEFFRDEGSDVVFLMDSVTRFCQAQRQIGLAAGEPPATKGYPPSVFAMLPSLLERAGRTASGSITGFYAILVEGDDLTEPVSDAVRGILDGHVVLSRDLANRAHWPAIDVLDSVSRVAVDVIDDTHRAARDQVIRLISAYRQIEDLVNIGAYAEGANPDYDLAIAAQDDINALLRQGLGEDVDYETSRNELIQLALRLGQAEQQLRAAAQRPAPVGVPTATN